MKHFSLLHSVLALITVNAFANPVEIQFQGKVNSLNFSQNVYGQIESQYAPSDFLSATSFSGILRYDDGAVSDYQAPGGSSVYQSSIQFTIAGSYTIQSQGVVYISNDYGDRWWDSIAFYFNDFSTPFITPDDEMTVHDTWLGVSFYDHSSSAFNNQALPSGNLFPSLSAFDYLPINLTIQSSADTILLPCGGPPCTGEPALFDPSQSINLDGSITAYSVSEVPLPPSGLLLTPALLLLFKRKAWFGFA